MFDTIKKILIISNMYPSTKDPYYGTFVKNFYESIKYDSRFYVKKIVIKGRSSSIIAKIIKYINFYFSVIWNVLFCNFDLMYVHTISHTSPPLRLLSNVKKEKIIFNIHGNDLLPQSNFTKYLRNISRPLLEKSVRIVVPSFYYRHKLLHVFPSVDKNKVFVSPSGGINSKFYTFHTGVKSNNIIFRIGYVSRIDKGKGWDILLEALHILKKNNLKYEASIYGRGDQTRMLKNMIIELGLSECVSYKGPCTQEELVNIYKSFDVFVFPTMREAESLGLVGLEAMAGGTPVIGSRIGGLNSYIEDGKNGYFFNPGDVEGLAYQLNKYYHLPDQEKKRIQSEAYKTSLKYESSIVQNELLDMVYDVAVHNHQL